MFEERWQVFVDENHISLMDDAGVRHSLAKRDMIGVMVETNDSGPWGADVWWLLFGADDRIALSFPQGAEGEQRLLDYLVALENFDHAAMAKAMRSVENAVFPLWRRPPDT